MTEHAYIDELQAQLFGASIVFQDISNHILEKNIYGVDINEESVDIAKLSLWLRTAQRGRKLTTLNNNIKCGNSLIDEIAVAGEKAFNWQNEFPSVFTEKEKKPWHITCATHNSRYSQRMFHNYVKRVWAPEPVISRWNEPCRCRPPLPLPLPRQEHGSLLPCQTKATAAQHSRICGHKSSAVTR